MDEEENGVIGVGQIARSVTDLAVSKNFFENILQLPHLYTFGNMAFFDCGGSRLMLAEKEEVNMQESLLYFSVDNITQSWEMMKIQGVEFLQPPHKIHVHDDGTQEWMAFFEDPDGRPLALMSRQQPSGITDA